MAFELGFESGFGFGFGFGFAFAQHVVLIVLSLNYMYGMLSGPCSTNNAQFIAFNFARHNQQQLFTL